MNWVDIVLVLVVLLSVLGGWNRGFILSTLDLVNWIGSLLLGFLFYPYLANFLQNILPSLGAWLLPVAFLITIILARVLIGIVTSRIAWASGRANNSAVNKFLGIIPGFITGIIYATIIAALLLALPLWKEVTDNTRNSRIADRLSTEVDWVNEKLSPVFDKAIKQTINNLTIHPDSNETVKLPFKDEHPEVRADLEAKMLQLLNQERVQRGLSPLQADPELTEVAREHSKDMFARGYFAHFTPEGKSPFDRMDAAHIQYSTAGENLALAHSLSIAHNGLMNSPGHRANILNPSFGRVGIGILDGGFYGLMVSQEFRNR
ncbi:MAG TPA: CvpA family protein [Chitinophagaceae bacterium]